MSDAKVALVTGSSSGIGRATVKLLSQKGYKVVVVGSKSEKVNQVAEECDQVSSNGHKVSQKHNQINYHLRQLIKTNN